MKNPLESIMDGYKVTLDSIRVTSLVIEKNVPNIVLKRHTFFAASDSENLARLKAAQAQLSELTVLSLVSTFERTLRDHLLTLPRIHSPGENDLDEKARRQIISGMEYWKLADEILTVFSARVDRNIIGQVRQIVEYRNWVAHGRSVERLPTANIVPQFANKVLNEFFSQAGLV